MITEGYLVRHYQGRRGGRGPAVIDIAQDHLLYLLVREGLFDLGVALKGGTALRKFWAGNAGRFSTDLDFAGMDDAAAALLVELVDGARVGQFGFGVEELDGTQRMRLLITSPFGETDVPARLDLGRRALWLPPKPMVLLPMPIHKRYEFEPPAIPAARLEETIAEKLARFRRGSLARDLYDLAWAASRPFDEGLVRRLVVLKVWTDVLDDGLGVTPFDPDEILRERSANEFKPEAIGYLTTPVDVPGWVNAVRDRFGFMRAMDAQEQRWARCSRADEWEVRQAIAALAGYTKVDP
ncbi:MAG: nucleotidyl transferase AbiEii/AbiGii toxin family protein [Coriobacteriales bacterium]|nr:nucleotidyl transferase AbiEii/AbiGii toxin family protein [Coriobacteriales bacterium]